MELFQNIFIPLCFLIILLFENMQTFESEISENTFPLERLFFYKYIMLRSNVVTNGKVHGNEALIFLEKKLKSEILKAKKC